MATCCLSQTGHISFACHFQTVHPIPVIFISILTKITSPFQWHSWISKLRPGSIIPFQILHMHHIPHPAYHTMFASYCLRFAHGWLCLPLVVVLAWVEPGDEYVIEEPVEYTYEDQANGNSENFAGKMTIPSKSLLSLLASCSLYCYAYVVIPTTCYIMPPILPCQTSNPPCPSKPLFGYVTALLSPSYSIASSRWRL